MRRKIRIRAWDSRTKKMIYRFFEPTNQEPAYQYILTQNAKGHLAVYCEGDGISLPLMEYVGQNDQKNHRIYEGDILIDKDGWRGEVVYLQDGFLCLATDGSNDWTIDWEHLEIIGNIYEGEKND